MLRTVLFFIGLALSNADSSSPQTFLTSNKERVDDDPDANPYDDLRHYAYEVGFNFNKISVFVVFKFKPPFSRVMAIPGARYRR